MAHTKTLTTKEIAIIVNCLRTSQVLWLRDAEQVRNTRLSEQFMRQIDEARDLERALDQYPTVTLTTEDD